MQTWMKIIACLVVVLFASFVAPARDEYPSEAKAEGIPVPPSNKEINKALDAASEYLEKAKEVGADKISANAQAEKEKIVEDLQDVLESAKAVLENKNRGDILQRFVLHSGQALKQVATEALPKAKDVMKDDLSGISKEIETELIKRRANRLLNLARSLIFQVWKSDDFRDLLSEFSNWFQEGFVQPFVETSKETASKLADTGMEAAQKVMESGKETVEKLSETVKEGKILEKGSEAAKAAYDSYDEASSAADRLMEHSKEAAEEIAKKFREALQDPERRKEVMQRFNGLWNRIAKDPKLRQGMNQMIELVELLKEQSLKVKESLEDTVKKAAEATSESIETQYIEKAMEDGRQLLNQLLGVRPGEPSPLETLADGLKEMFMLVSEDENTKNFFHDSKNFLLQTIEKPELLVGVAEEQAGMAPKAISRETQLASHHHKQKGEELLSRAGDVFSTLKYGRPTRKILQALRRLDHLVRNDPVGNRFASSLKRLLKDISLDVTEGSLNFNLATLMRMKDWLIPLISDSLANITLPAISGSTDTYDFSLEGLKLSDAVIKPENVHVVTTEDMDLNLEHIALERIHADVSLHINNIKTSIKDAKFSFRRKTFPRISDEGTVDLELSGDGTSLVIDLEAVYHLDKPTEFTVKNIECKVDELDIHVKDARHKWLYNLIRTFFSGALKRRFESAVEDSLWTSIGEFSNSWQKFSELTSEAVDSLKSKLGDTKETISCVVDNAMDKAKEVVGIQA